MSQQDKGQGEPSMEEILASIRRIISDDDKDEEPAAEEAAPAAVPAAEVPVAAAPVAPAAPAEKIQPAAAAVPAAAPAIPVPDAPPVAEIPAVAATPDAPLQAPAEVEITEVVDTPPVEGAEELELTEIIEDVPAAAPVAAPAAPAKPKPAASAPKSEVLAEEGRKAFLQETGSTMPAVISGDTVGEDFVGLVSPPIREISTNTLAELAGAIHARGFMLGNVAMTLEDLIRDLMRPHLKDWLDKNLPGIVERMVRAEIERMASEAEARKDLI